MNLYYLMTILFVFLAILGAFDMALVDFHLVPWFNGMVWLRVHLITLGALTEVVFGTLPQLLAQRHGKPRPPFRGDIWLTLNGGILLLLVGIPLVNAVPIFAGGTLVFTATILLIVQLVGLRGGETGVSPSRNFYLAGLFYFLLGIILGTGMWIGWMAPLGVKVPVEAHIHANNWGFMAMVFSGLLIDLSPALWARPLATDKTLRTIFWLMALGAAGLVFGPWFGSNAVLVPGLVLHLAGMLWLLRLIIGPLWGRWRVWGPGTTHLISAYIWILAPLAFAPFVILKASWIPGSRIEANAPQALIYGWVLQFGFALLPFLFRQIFTPDKPAKLGGSWVSVVAIHLGAVCLWLSIFISPAQNLLHGFAYLSWGVAMLPFAREIWQISREGLAYLEKKRLLTAS